jgi:hypothetical protein
MAPHHKDPIHWRGKIKCNRKKLNHIPVHIKNFKIRGNNHEWLKSGKAVGGEYHFLFTVFNTGCYRIDELAYFTERARSRWQLFDFAKAFFYGDSPIDCLGLPIHHFYSFGPSLEVHQIEAEKMNFDGWCSNGATHHPKKITTKTTKLWMIVLYFNKPTRIQPLSAMV